MNCVPLALPVLIGESSQNWSDDSNLRTARVRDKDSVCKTSCFTVLGGTSARSARLAWFHGSCCRAVNAEDSDGCQGCVGWMPQTLPVLSGGDGCRRPSLMLVRSSMSNSSHSRPCPITYLGWSILDDRPETSTTIPRNAAWSAVSWIGKGRPLGLTLPSHLVSSSSDCHPPTASRPMPGSQANLAGGAEAQPRTVAQLVSRTASRQQTVAVHKLVTSLDV